MLLFVNLHLPGSYLLVDGIVIRTAGLRRLFKLDTGLRLGDYCAIAPHSWEILGLVELPVGREPCVNER